MRTVLSLLLAGLAAGCAATPPAGGPPPADLVGPTWRLVAIGGDAVPADAGVTLTFGTDGGVSGSSGCNRFSGTADLGPGSALGFSPLASTRRACAPPAMEREQAFLTALQAADRAVVTDGELRLSGARPLRFIASEAGASEAGASETATLTGTVAYRQRIALAPNAVVTVRLLDVSLADAPSVTLAEQTIRPEGRQVPIPFALDYDAARVEARRRYVVRAEIRDADGALLWTTDTATPVLTQGAPMDGVEVRVVQVGE